MELSQKEHNVLTLIACGYSDKEIGVKLKISPRTVQTYQARIIGKLNARNKTNAVVIYIKKNPKWRISERHLL